MNPKETVVVVRSRKQDVARFARKFPTIADWIAEATELINNQAAAIKELLAHLLHVYHHSGIEPPEGVELAKLVEMAIDTARLIDSLPNGDETSNE